MYIYHRKTFFTFSHWQTQWAISLIQNIYKGARNFAHSGGGVNRGYLYLAQKYHPDAMDVTFVPDYDLFSDEVIVYLLRFLAYRVLISVSALNLRWRGLAKEEMRVRNKELEGLEPIGEGHSDNSLVDVSDARSLEAVLWRLRPIKDSPEHYLDKSFKDTDYLLYLHWRYGFTLLWSGTAAWRTSIEVWEVIFAHPTILAVDLRTLLYKESAVIIAEMNVDGRTNFARLVDNYPRLSPELKRQFSRYIETAEADGLAHRTIDIVCDFALRILQDRLTRT